MEHLESKDLEVFVVVAEKGSFSAAARSLRRSQPSVSERVARLEEKLGVQLFDRRRRGVSVTGAGRVVLDHARAILSRERALRDAVASLGSRIEGRLSIGASSIPSVHLLPGALARFLKLHPDLRPSVHSASSRQVIDRLLAGVDELALVGEKPELPQLEGRRLCEDELLLVLPVGHPLARRSTIRPADLIGQPLLLRETGSGTQGAMEGWFAEGEVELEDLSPVAKFGTSEAIRAAVVEGMGVAILSSLAVRSELAAGTLQAVALDGGRHRRFFWVVRERGRAFSPAAEAFFGFLLSELAGQVGP